MRFPSIWSIALLTLAACAGQDPAGNAVEVTASAAKSGFIPMSAENIAGLGLKFETAAPADQAPIAVVPALISPPANARVAVAATFPGVITRTLVVMGETVRKGQALAVVASRDILTIGADLSRAQARLGVAQSSADRLSQLNREGIISGARAEEARAVLAEARVDVSEKSRVLRMVNGSGGSGTYTLTAPIAGRVTTALAQAGTVVDGASAPYVIDAEGRYEAEAQLPERLAGQVRPGMIVSLGGDIRGTVTAVGSTIDPATRSVTLKASLPSGPGIVAGRAASLSLFGPAPVGAVTVSAAAITMLDGQEIAFVRTTKGIAVRRVRTGGRDGERMLILSGLKPGEQVVSVGASALKPMAAQ